MCIPPPPDLDCGDIPYRNFRVPPPDPHRFDGSDRDGIGYASLIPAPGAGAPRADGPAAQPGTLPQPFLTAAPLTAGGPLRETRCSGP